MLLAGFYCDRLTRLGRQDAPVIVALIAALGIASFGCLPTLMPSADWVYVAIFVAGLTFNAYNGVGPMAVNQVTPNQYRATVSAVYLFVVNALGLGIGGMKKNLIPSSRMRCLKPDGVERRRPRGWYQRPSPVFPIPY